MPSLILKKGVDLTHERVAKEIRARFVVAIKGSEPYTRVTVISGKNKKEISIAVSEKDVIHETLDKSPLLMDGIDSMQFMDGVVNK